MAINTGTRFGMSRQIGGLILIELNDEKKCHDCIMSNFGAQEAREREY
jgi:hypothetical protein